MADALMVFPHVFSFLTLEELCHLACASKELQRVVYKDAGQRWESALEALETNCANQCMSCGKRLPLSCECEDGKKYMEKYAEGSDESLAFSFTDPRLSASFHEMTTQERVSRLLSFQQACVLRLRDHPRFSLFADCWSCEPPILAEDDYSPLHATVNRHFRDLYGVDEDGNLLQHQPSLHYRLLYHLAALVVVATELNNSRGCSCWPYWFGGDVTHERLDMYHRGEARRININSGSSLNNSMWEVFYESFFEDPELAGVVPGSDEHFEYMFRKGAPPQALVDAFGPRLAPSLDILAKARVQWQDFRDGNGISSEYNDEEDDDDSIVEEDEHDSELDDV